MTTISINQKTGVRSDAANYKAFPVDPVSGNSFHRIQSEASETGGPVYVNVYVYLTTSSDDVAAYDLQYPLHYTYQPSGFKSLPADPAYYVAVGYAPDGTSAAYGMNDTLVGGLYNDVLYGGLGDDVLGQISGSANLSYNRMFGGSGNDTLNGGNGGDRLFGDHF